MHKLAVTKPWPRSLTFFYLQGCGLKIRSVEKSASVA